MTLQMALLEERLQGEERGRAKSVKLLQLKCFVVEAPSRKFTNLRICRCNELKNSQTKIATVDMNAVKDLDRYTLPTRAYLLSCIKKLQEEGFR